MVRRDRSFRRAFSTSRDRWSFSASPFWVLMAPVAS